MGKLDEKMHNDFNRVLNGNYFNLFTTTGIISYYDIAITFNIDIVKILWKFFLDLMYWLKNQQFFTFSKEWQKFYQGLQKQPEKYNLFQENLKWYFFFIINIKQYYIILNVINLYYVCSYFKHKYLLHTM